eukprot:16428303-Heterocapsa_arctica.AAC.1
MGPHGGDQLRVLGRIVAGLDVEVCLELAFQAGEDRAARGQVLQVLLRCLLQLHELGVRVPGAMAKVQDDGVEVDEPCLAKVRDGPQDIAMVPMTRVPEGRQVQAQLVAVLQHEAPTKPIGALVWAHHEVWSVQERIVDHRWWGEVHEALPEGLLQRRVEGHTPQVRLATLLLRRQGARLRCLAAPLPQPIYRFGKPSRLGLSVCLLVAGVLRELHIAIELLLLLGESEIYTHPMVYKCDPKCPQSEPKVIPK